MSNIIVPAHAHAGTSSLYARAIERVNRLTFLREAGLKDCTLTPVFKPQISPRNLAIIEAGLKDCTLTPVFNPQISPRNLAIIVNYV